MNDRKKTVIQDIKLADFPEEINEQNNIKVYGETSWENQLAVLSHYLHNNDCIESKESKREVIYAIREFLEQKKESKKEEITDEYVTKVAEDPTAYGLFSDFFNVPFLILKTKIHFHRPICRNGRFPPSHAGARWQVCILVGMEQICPKDLLGKLWRNAFWRHYKRNNQKLYPSEF